MPDMISITAIVPAAGVGSRMQADKPKQYLQIQKKTILEHTVEKLLAHPLVTRVIVAIGVDDPYYNQLTLAQNPQVIRVDGGNERADSVLSALNYLSDQAALTNDDWVMVHDAARPCFEYQDIDNLIKAATEHSVGAILAAPVRDTMKRSDHSKHITQTVERNLLWHALTPQMFRTELLFNSLSSAMQQGANITDEASALEFNGLQPVLVSGRSDNLKITQPEDLALAEFYLTRLSLHSTKDKA